MNKLINQVNDTSPALREIGEYLLGSTQDRMSNEVDIHGSPFEPLKLSTILEKQKTGQSDKILRGYGTMADTLNYQLNGDQLMFGSNMIYAAKQQFEYDREFLGFSNDDENEIIDILQQHLA